MEHFKLQLGCILIIFYIMFVYIRERRRFHQQKRWTIFHALLEVGALCVIFDGLTSYTVNHLDTVSKTWNMILHMFFLISLDSIIFLLFLYMWSITAGLPKRKSNLGLLVLPFVVNVVVVVVNMPSLQYRIGTISNYSMGISAYTCFIMAGIYTILSIAIFFRRWKYIESHKRWNVFTYLLIMAGVTVYQMLHPDVLLSSICVTIIILGIYMNQENPTVLELTRYHEEMIMGFATLVENKDGSTGGHIKRTTAYVKLLSEELRSRGYYKDILTKDYLKNLCLAAPMHDIGKIAVPDVILQKPGRLTEEEFAIIKQHTEHGAKIVQETFGHLGNEEYAKMAYEVARYHHEKWNGHGYPEGLKQNEIPLCARIMAIADVFDAVSEKRCYRDAMPMEKCFEIIRDGCGQEFDPIIATVFLDISEKVNQIHNKINAKSGVVKKTAA